MQIQPTHDLLEPLLDAWQRNNAILLNLLRIVPAGGLAARVFADSPTVAQLYAHIRFCRICTVFESDPAMPLTHPERLLSDEDEWRHDSDPGALELMLLESADVVTLAVSGWIGAGTAIAYDHPIILMQHLLWHEGYHVGQIKLALKAAGLAIADREAGPATWDVWRQRVA